LAWKVFIIDEAHMLSTPAFNALLKILEEPPSSVMFILATTELYKVPATVVSRCQRFDFKKIPPDAMRARLEYLCAQEKKSVDAQVLETIVRLSSGCQRDAETLLDQVLSLDEKHITKEKASVVLPMSSLELVKEYVDALIRKDAKRAVYALERAIENGIDLGALCSDILEFSRTLLLIKAGAQDLIQEGAREIEERVALCADTTEQDIISFIDHMIEAQRTMRYVSLPQLPFEIAIAKLCEGRPSSP
jgi:DNA polymerase-3 subunit gamma/tau